MFLALTQAAHAVSAEDLMEEAVRAGKSSGELTGGVAEHLKKITHSTDPTQARIERIGEDGSGCQTYKFTITQPNIPSRQGAVVGDYVTVTKNRFCQDNKARESTEVIDCHIGAISCMPAKSAPPAATSPKRN